MLPGWTTDSEAIGRATSRHHRGEQRRRRSPPYERTSSTARKASEWNRESPLRTISRSHDQATTITRTYKPQIEGRSFSFTVTRSYMMPLRVAQSLARKLIFTG